MNISKKTPNHPHQEPEIDAAAHDDPDAQPLTEADFKRMQRAPKVRVIRTALGLTQGEFADRYKIPLGTLRDWEQRRSEPDNTARAYLNLIAREPLAARMDVGAAPPSQPAIDIERLRKIAGVRNRYGQQLNRLSQQRKEVSSIEIAVEKSIATIDQGVRAFVIYGEPQSGKTEMMICLTAKLLDAGFSVIVHLLNDSVQLLQQNLDRFQRSGLAPAAKNFSDLLDPSISLKNSQHVIFCKKNAKDLHRLAEKLDGVANKIIIDDEADFATPNAKVNRGEVTRINALVGQLIGNDGRYIGVTATPARLDLNNTFDNDNEEWVDFPAHRDYTGQAIFFPIGERPSYRLVLLPDSNDSPRYLREALFRFMATVAFINLNSSREENFSFLIHTSGIKMDHRADKKPIEDVLQALANVDSAKFAEYALDIRTAAEKLFGSANADRILDYVIQNGSRSNVVIMNSERDKNVDFKAATSPAALFTIIIGGNIVSRGVTFENLLSMFFTRDTKHKIQQDTYIQRARMFGSRKSHLHYFELAIPESLYLDWHRCFVFHKLSLDAIRNNLGSPVWLSDDRISAVSASSVDKANVTLDKGEMSFSIFQKPAGLDAVMGGRAPAMERLRAVQKLIGKTALPDYLLKYVESTSPAGDSSIALHPADSIDGYRETEKMNKEKIERRQGFIGEPQMQRSKFPDAIHHFKVFFNSKGNARMFYKFEGSIKFIKNLKNVG